MLSVNNVNNVDNITNSDSTFPLSDLEILNRILCVILDVVVVSNTLRFIAVRSLQT